MVEENYMQRIKNSDDYFLHAQLCIHNIQTGTDI